MDPVKSCEAAARYLLDAYNMFGDWNLAIAAYNCGAGNVRKAIKRADGSRKFWDIWPYLPSETRMYVPAFVGALYTLEYYKEHGLKPEAMAMPAGVDTLEIKKQLHLKQVSEMTGAPLDELKNLNPQYRHEIIPGHERPYILRIPYQYTTTFIEREDTIYKHKAAVYFDPITIRKIKEGGDGVRIVYQVKSGDYLGSIAKKHNVSVAKIKQWNNLKSDNIRIGQKLVIYRGGSAPASSSKSSSSGKTTKSSASNAKGHTTYTVKSGDSFYSIAKNYPGVSAQNIMDYNGISSSNLKPGMTIKIPQF
jgi:membrane-bound lytic murein transglycosylase D